MEWIPVRDEGHIQRLVEMADEIWHEYWPERIGAAQTDYMVERFQSYEAISRDMREQGYEYWILRQDGRDLGYTGGHSEPETGRFFISKIYLYKHERGRSYASRTIEFYVKLCHERSLSALYLSVNKNNDQAIRAYRSNGFEVIDEGCFPIGEGFFMDDYIMEKSLR